MKPSSFALKILWKSNKQPWQKTISTRISMRFRGFKIRRSSFHKSIWNPEIPRQSWWRRCQSTRMWWRSWATKVVRRRWLEMLGFCRLFPCVSWVVVFFRFSCLAIKNIGLEVEAKLLPRTILTVFPWQIFQPENKCFFHGILPRTIGSTMGIYSSYHGGMGMKAANYWEHGWVLSFGWVHNVCVCIYIYIM